MSNGRRILTFFGSLVLLAGAGVLVLWQYGVPQLGVDGIAEAEVRRTIQSVQAFADKEQSSFEQWFIERRREVSLLARGEDLAAHALRARSTPRERRALDRRLTDVANANPGAYDGLVIAGAHDLALLGQANPGVAPLTDSQRAAMREVLQPGLQEFVTLDEASTPERGPQLLVAHQIEAVDGDGQFTGEVAAILLATIELAAPAHGHEVLVRQALGPQGALLLVNDRGQVLALRGGEFAAEELAELGRYVIAGSEAVRRVRLGQRGEHVMVYRHLHLGADSGLSIVALRSTEDAVAVARSNLLGLGAIVGVGALLSWALLLVAARRIDGAESEVRSLNAGLERRVQDRTHELHHALEAAEEASRAKTAFLSTVSHELRTPLNGIIGMSELLMSTPLEREQMRQMDVVRRSGRDLLKLINDLLDFAKSDGGHLRLEAIDFDAREIAREVIEMLSISSPDKRIRLRGDLPLGPVLLHGDPHRLRQVLANLVANGIKFTAEGEVVLRFSADPAPDGSAQNRQRFEVSDTGIGIAAEQLPQLFRAFSQLEASMARRFGGTGLGLAISQQLVQLMGGRIDVTSRIGAGSTFSFTLHMPPARNPLSVPQRAAALATPGPDALAKRAWARGSRVLLVEDNPVNREVAAAMLTSLGVDADCAENGAQALAALDDGHPYALVLMDCQMPVMDGFEATRRIRVAQAESGMPHVPIVALTANVMAGDREHCMQAGMDDHLAKPFTLESLRSCLQRWLGTSAAVA